MKITSIGMLLLAIYLILIGLIQLLGLTFNGMQYVTGGLAVAAGVCVLINK
jgi:hypothetical protein